MKAVSDRRTFVRNVVVGVPALAALTSMPSVSSALAAHEGSRSVPMLDSMLRDLARLHNQMRHRPLTQEDVRAVSSHLRALAAYQVRSNRDVDLTRAVREAIDRQGRDAFVKRPADIGQIRHELVAFGLDSPLLSAGTAGIDVRSNALARIASSGFAPVFSEAGEMVQNLELLYLTAGASSCDTLKEMIETMEALTAVSCALAAAIPVLAPECFAASMVLAALMLIAWVRSC